MNEVEKMYKTIFGEFAPNCSLCTKLIDCEIINNTHNCNNFECDYKRLFTAEKQLELIKWLAKNKSDYGLQYRGSAWCNCCDFYWEYFDKDSEDKNFEESLAGLINILWQSLTEEERTQIKEILE